MESNTEISDYHKTRSVLDCKYVVSIFDKQERQILTELQVKYPNHIIRMSNSDLIAAGHISGIGGSVPSNWNRQIYDTLA